MKMPRIALAILTVSVLILSTSCAATTTSDSSAAPETTAVIESTAAIETTAAEATDITAAPMETTAETTAPADDPNVLIIKTDWNGDGVEDTFRRESTKPSLEVNGVLTYTDGATGQTTDITKRCAADDTGCIFAFTDITYLYEDESGNRMILDSFDVCSSDYMTFVYTYDPVNIIAYTEVGGLLTVEDDQVLLVRDSSVFGNLNAMIVPAAIKDNTLTAKDIGNEIWWMENRGAVNDPSLLPPVKTSTRVDFAAEKISGDTVEAITIPAGTDIYPLYTVTDETGAGVVYFRTAADGDCQASFTVDDDGYPVMFGDTNQDELFFCGWGD